jgi:hypothetical protein
MPLLYLIIFTVAGTWLLKGKFAALLGVRKDIWDERKIRSYHDRKGGKLRVDIRNSGEMNTLTDAIDKNEKKTKSKIWKEKI